MESNIYALIVVMASVTYLIRLLPLILLRIDIQNRYIKSFLYYVPFVTLTVMTFPAVLEATGSLWSALCGFVLAVFLAYTGSSLIKVSAFACLSVFVMELILL